MTHSSGRVLVVDDHADIRHLLSVLLRKNGFIVETAADGVEAIALLDAAAFDTIVSDINMPGMDGMALLRRVRERDLDVPVILMTGLPSIESAAEAVAYGALRYLVKPLDLAGIGEVVQKGISLRRMARIQREAAAHLGAMGELPSDRAGLETRFSRALGAVWMAYQPIISHSKHTVYAYEALLRSADHTMAAPPALLEAAERLGRLTDLGRMIRARVAESSGGTATGHLLFVNLHPRDLLDDELFGISRPLTALANRVVLEVTERASLDGIHDMGNRIARLRAMGFRIAVDDLGAGYSGLSAVVQLQPDVIKLDISLVRHVDTESTKQRLVRSMATLCRDMGIFVIAEGVETTGERDMLVELGCDLFQGYLYAKPGRGFVEPAWAT